AGEEISQLVQEAFALGRHVLVFKLGKFPKQLFLAFVQMLWRFYHNLHKQIALATASQIGQPFARHSNNRSVLSAALELPSDRTVERRDFNFAAQRGLTEADGHVANQVLVLPLKESMIANTNDAVEIAARGARIACFSLSRNSNGGPCINSRRDV